MAHFDVCINPQSVNDITIGNYPRKVDEYLALGKPVVATKTKTMEIFNGYVYNCTGADEYVQSIRAALEKDTTEERKGAWSLPIRIHGKTVYPNYIITLTNYKFLNYMLESHPRLKKFCIIS